MDHKRRRRSVKPAGLLLLGSQTHHSSRYCKSKRRITAQTRRHENDAAHDTCEGGKLDIKASVGGNSAAATATEAGICDESSLAVEWTARK